MANNFNNVQGLTQSKLYNDSNYQQADLFKQNVKSQQVQQGLSFNTWQANINRQINNAFSGIFQEQQQGLTGNSALKQMIQTQQQAGTAIAQTTNNYFQSQQEAYRQIDEANLEQETLRKQYSIEAGQELYAQDLQDERATEDRDRKISSGIFGGIQALGGLLSLIPFTAPVGLALDAIGAAGMVGTSAAYLAKNPSTGSGLQFGIDTLFAGLSLIPGLGAASAAAKVGGAEAKFGLRTATTLEESLNTGITGEQIVNSTLPSLNRAKELNQVVSPTVKYGNVIDRINSAKTIEQVEVAAEQSGLTVDEIAKARGLSLKGSTKTAKDLKNSDDIGIVTKFKNQVHKNLQKRGSFARSVAAENRRTVKLNNIVNSRSILSKFNANARWATGGVIRAGIRGGVTFGGRYILSGLTSNIGNNPKINATNARWTEIFNQLNIPQNLRPAGL